MECELRTGFGAADTPQPVLKTVTVLVTVLVLTWWGSTPDAVDAERGSGIAEYPIISCRAACLVGCGFGLAPASLKSELF